MALVAVSCQRGSIGVNQPPVDATLLVYQPSYGMHKLNGASAQEVGFTTTLRVFTTDANYNIVNYPGGIQQNSQTTSATSTTIAYGKEYTLRQPQGATHIAIDVVVESIDCGWPVPNETWSVEKYIGQNNRKD